LDADDAPQGVNFARRNTIRRHLTWNGYDGFFADVLWRDGRLTDILSAPTVYPPTVGVATPEEGHAVAAALRERLLEPAGLGTTLTTSGPAMGPAQWLDAAGISGDRRHERLRRKDLAHEIAQRWIGANVRGYAQTGALVEKYDAEQGPEQGGWGGRGGEYPLQDGFGWTNGVLTKLMAEYPPISPCKRCDRTHVGQRRLKAIGRAEKRGTSSSVVRLLGRSGIMPEPRARDVRENCVSRRD
jgi:alpha,alpha-trehalase